MATTLAVGGQLGSKVGLTDYFSFFSEIGRENGGYFFQNSCLKTEKEGDEHSI